MVSKPTQIRLEKQKILREIINHAFDILVCPLYALDSLDKRNLKKVLLMFNIDQMAAKKNKQSFDISTSDGAQEEDDL